MTGDRTYNMFVHKMMLQPTELPGQGWSSKAVSSEPIQVVWGAFWKTARADWGRTKQVSQKGE